MVGASAALAVVVGQATSIGGDCFLLFHEAASGRTFGLNASGVAPALAEPKRFPDGMQTRGPLAPVVPGLVRAWDVMHRRFGRLKWKDLFDQAIALAQGHPVSKVLAERLPENADALAHDPGCAALDLPQGRPIAVGELLRQPALAASWQSIATQGADEFYMGDLAHALPAFKSSAAASSAPPISPPMRRSGSSRSRPTIGAIGSRSCRPIPTAFSC
jgi:gamma-glutamyltranspeptidase/glutathione hydrolase